MPRPPATDRERAVNRMAADKSAPGADGVDRRVVLLHPQDNCVIACMPIKAGTVLRLDGRAIVAASDVALGHKIARRALRSGDKELRYGAVIGSVTRAVAPGEHLHLHNLKSDYLPTYTLAEGERFVGGAAPPKDAP